MWLTRNNVTEAYGGHGDEAEVDGVEEAPVLVDGEQVRAHLRQAGIISWQQQQQYTWVG